MAWIFADSFDLYDGAADIVLGGWDSMPTTPTLVTGRFAASQSIGNVFAAGVELVKTSGSNDATHHIVAAIFHNTALSGTDYRYITLMDGATAQCSIVFRSDGTILLTAGGPTGSTLATYSSAFAQTVWAAFEFEITINNSTGAFHVRKDGVGADSFAATGLNTRGSSNNYANQVQIGSNGFGGNNNHQLLDDFLWFSTSGSAPNTWVGDVRSVTLLPSADTAQKQFAPNSGSANFSRVNEAHQDGDTSTVTDTVVGHNDLYDLANLAGTPLAIIAVQTKAMMRKSDAGSRAGQVQVKSGTTTVTSTATPLSTSYHYLSRVDTVDPDTSAAWTAAAVNALQIGPILAS